MPRSSFESDDASGSQSSIDNSHELHPVDVLVGRKVRSRRITLGMSEEELGSAIGVTAEQICLYEAGSKRIGARLLYEVSIALEYRPIIFFEDMQT